jgi:hypothetical protein
MHQLFSHIAKTVWEDVEITVAVLSLRRSPARREGRALGLKKGLTDRLASVAVKEFADCLFKGVAFHI